MGNLHLPQRKTNGLQPKAWDRTEKRDSTGPGKPQPKTGESGERRTCGFRKGISERAQKDAKRFVKKNTNLTIDKTPEELSKTDNTDSSKKLENKDQDKNNTEKEDKGKK